MGIIIIMSILIVIGILIIISILIITSSNPCNISSNMQSSIMAARVLPPRNQLTNKTLICIILYNRLQYFVQNTNLQYLNPQYQQYQYLWQYFESVLKSVFLSFSSVFCISGCASILHQYLDQYFVSVLSPVFCIGGICSLSRHTISQQQCPIKMLPA